jgi:hypothetical protein
MYLKTLFKFNSQEIVDIILNVASLLPSFIVQEKKKNLRCKVSKEELLRVLQSFEEDNNPCRDGLTIEFFLGLFDFVGDDLLIMVEYSRTSREFLVVFNATFIVVSPK